MAKEKSRFTLNKGGDHTFDISKGGKRKFDLTKDDDEPVIVSPTEEDSKSVSTSMTEPTEQPSKENDRKKWLWIILGIFAIVVLAWIFIPKSNDNNDGVITHGNEEVASTATADEDTVAVEEVVVEENVIEEDGQSKAKENNSPEVRTPETPVAQPVNSSVSSVKSTTVSDDVEQEALKVIRGEYGIGQERKNNLGSKYQAIQSRVNELKRDGVF